MLQFKYRSFARGQFFKRALKTRMHFPCRQVAFRVARMSPVGHPVQDLAGAAVLGDLQAHGFVRVPTTSQVVKAAVRHDAIEPGVERALKSKAGEILIGAQEGFLTYVLRVVLRSGETQRQPESRFVVLSHQLVESRGVATLRF